MCLLINRLTSRPISRTACFSYGLLPLLLRLHHCGPKKLIYEQIYILSAMIGRSCACDCRCGCPNVSVRYLRPINLPSAFSLSLSLSHDVSPDFPPNLNTISTQLIADYANQLEIYTIHAYIYRCICVCCRCFLLRFVFWPCSQLDKKRIPKTIRFVINFIERGGRGVHRDRGREIEKQNGME